MFNMTSTVRAVSLDINLDDKCTAEHPESLETWKVGHVVCFFFFSDELLDPVLKLKGGSPDKISERKTY